MRWRVFKSDRNIACGIDKLKVTQGSNRLHTIVAVETLNFGFHSESNALADLIFAPENKISDVILCIRGIKTIAGKMN